MLTGFGNNTTVKGKFERPNDVDYFTFNGGEFISGYSGGRTIKISVTTPGDASVRLEDDKGNSLVSNITPAATNTIEHLVSNSKAYFIRVRSSNKSGSYTMTLEWKGGQKDETTVIYSTSFEPGDTAWLFDFERYSNSEIGPDLPYWGEDQRESNQGVASIWCAGSDRNLVNSDSNYKPDMKAWAIYGPFDLSDARSGEFTFSFMGKTEDRLGEDLTDFLGAFVSIDGTQFHGWAYFNDWPNWSTAKVDFTDVPTLGDVTGINKVWIAVFFKSDSTVEYKGIWVDDLKIVKSPNSSLSEATTAKIAKGKEASAIVFRK